MDDRRSCAVCESARNRLSNSSAAVKPAFSRPSFSANDLGPKLAAYCKAGVREYIAVLLKKQRIEWRVLSGTQYRLLPPPSDGILKSPHLPGLWLDTQALFPLDRERLFAAIDRGVAAQR